MAFQLNVQLLVREGRIACPAKHGRINPATCLTCTKLISVTRNPDDIEHVRCRPWATGNVRWSAAH